LELYRKLFGGLIPNIRKAYTAIQLGIKDDIDLHRSGLNEEKHVYRAMKSRHRYVSFAGKWAAISSKFHSLCSAQKQK
jgi:hypothetical protein